MFGQTPKYTSNKAYHRHTMAYRTPTSRIIAIYTSFTYRPKCRRKLIGRIPTDAITVDKKAQVAHVKAVSFNNAQINIYAFNKVPLFFDQSETGVLYPTVYFTWTNPYAYPNLVVHEPVLQYLENGADLMLPGVSRRHPLPSFERGSAVTVSLSVDGQLKGPIAVGFALQSSAEIVAGGYAGRGLQILHVYRDTLWEFGPRGTPPMYNIEDATPSEDSLVASLIEASIDNAETEGGACVASDDVPDAKPAVQEESNPETIQDIPIEPMEELLLRCFLAGLKFRLTKSGQLPMDVGQFYAQCLLACVPENRRLDMKKTKYKKFATFLETINAEEGGPIVKIAKKGKGVDLIAEVLWSHPLLRQFEVTDERITDEKEKTICGPTITECFSVTEPVLPLLRAVTGKSSISRGDLLNATVIREIVTQYVKKQNLSDGKKVRMDPLLADVSRLNDLLVDWNTLMQKIQIRMTKTFVMRMPDGRELVKKVTMPRIAFKVESRIGNKKVTLVNNLATFGIDVKTICHEVQVGVAASATIATEAILCEGPQVQVQGNQVVFLAELLTGKYGIDKKFIDGLELAPKKKR